MLNLCSLLCYYIHLHDVVIFLEILCFYYVFIFIIKLFSLKLNALLLLKNEYCQSNYMYYVCIYFNVNTTVSIYIYEY